MDIERLNWASSIDARGGIGKSDCNSMGFGVSGKFLLPDERGLRVAGR